MVYFKKAFLLVVILGISIFGFIYPYEVDDVVVSGSAYGFTIGETKKQAYSKLAANLRNISQDYYIQRDVRESESKFLMTEPDYLVKFRPEFHDVGYSGMTQYDNWGFFFGNDYFDSLVLKFCEDSLCEIKRHRTLFEVI